MGSTRKPVWVKIIALVVSGLIGGGVYLSIWADKKAEQIEGPTIMRKDARDHIWVLVQTDLYEFDSGGSLLHQISLPELNIHSPLGDFQPEPSGDLLVAVMGTQQILHFNPTGNLKRTFSIKILKPAPHGPSSGGGFDSR